MSTGAIIAPFAFLGPEYDDRLARFYTSTTEREVFQRHVFAGILWGDSLADPEPLRKRLATEVTPAILHRIADEHRKGRRLYVATTDLDTKMRVVWDLGAIASSGEPGSHALFCDVILASCSVPAAFPPVPIDVQIDGRWYTELHVDGGVSASAFLPPSALGVRRDGSTVSDGTTTDVYVVVSGSLTPSPRAVERRLKNVFGEALAGILAGRQSDDLLKLFLLCRHARAGFHLLAVPDDVPAEGDPLVFEPAGMRRLYDRGRALGCGGHWADSPPGILPEAEPTPREGPGLRAVRTSDRESLRPVGDDATP